jgi:hypothetical protein
MPLRRFIGLMESWACFKGIQQHCCGSSHMLESNIWLTIGQNRCVPWSSDSSSNERLKTDEEYRS